VRERVLADPDIALRLEGLVVRKVIVVKDRIVNLVAG
jgi:leucyl-tRNA synthetase